MNIVNLNNIENIENYDKKLLLDVVKRILLIGEKDKNISLQSKYEKLDEKIKKLKEKEDKYIKLLSSASSMKLDLNEKIIKIESLNDSMKENLLEIVGSEI